jgi:hypothetical protein
MEAMATERITEIHHKIIDQEAARNMSSYRDFMTDVAKRGAAISTFSKKIPIKR